MLAIIGLTVFLVAVCFVGFGVKVFFHRSHQFPETSAGHSPAMRARGIQCPRVEEGLLHNRKDCTSCYGCSRQ